MAFKPIISFNDTLISYNDFKIKYNIDNPSKTEKIDIGGLIYTYLSKLDSYTYLQVGDVCLDRSHIHIDKYILNIAEEPIKFIDSNTTDDLVIDTEYAYYFPYDDYPDNNGTLYICIKSEIDDVEVISLIRPSLDASDITKLRSSALSHKFITGFFEGIDLGKNMYLFGSNQMFLLDLIDNDINVVTNTRSMRLLSSVHPTYINHVADLITELDFCDREINNKMVRSDRSVQLVNEGDIVDYVRIPDNTSEPIELSITYIIGDIIDNIKYNESKLITDSNELKYSILNPDVSNLLMINDALLRFNGSPITYGNFTEQIDKVILYPMDSLINTNNFIIQISNNVIHTHCINSDITEYKISSCKILSSHGN